MCPNYIYMSVKCGFKVIYRAQLTLNILALLTAYIIWRKSSQLE